MKALIGFGLENIRGLLFVTGAGWLYIGVAGFSGPAADIFGGAVLMAIGAYPYLRKKAR